MPAKFHLNLNNGLPSENCEAVLYSYFILSDISNEQLSSRVGALPCRVSADRHQAVEVTVVTPFIGLLTPSPPEGAQLASVRPPESAPSPESVGLDRVMEGLRLNTGSLAGRRSARLPLSSSGIRGTKGTCPTPVTSCLAPPRPSPASGPAPPLPFSVSPSPQQMPAVSAPPHSVAVLSSDPCQAATCNCLPHPSHLPALHELHTSPPARSQT